MILDEQRVDWIHENAVMLLLDDNDDPVFRDVLLAQLDLIETLRAAWKELNEYCLAFYMADSIIDRTDANYNDPAQVQFNTHLWLYSEQRQRCIGDGDSQ